MNELLEFISKQMSQNEFAIAGVMVTGLTTLMYQMKAVPTMIYNSLKRRIIYSVSLNESDKIYVYFNKWLYRHYSDYFRNTKLVTENKYDDNYDIIQSEYRMEQYEDSFIFWYKGNPIKLNKTVEKLEGAQDHGEYEMGTFELSIVWNKSLLNNFLNSIFEDYRLDLKQENKLKIYTTGHHNWEEFKTIKPTTLGNIILPVELKSSITESISKWKTNTIKLKNLGISRNLCHLYDGPPGSGKTTTLMAIAYDNGMNVYYLNLNSINSVTHLTNLISSLPDNAMLVIEELEDVWDGREKKDSSCKIPISAFLNILSGTLSKDGLMVIMTSNDVSKLDPALVRPGRVDLKATFVKPTREMVCGYLDVFYSNSEYKFENHEWKWMPESMAELENECLKDIDNIRTIINKIKGYELESQNNG